MSKLKFSYSLVTFQITYLYFFLQLIEQLKLFQSFVTADVIKIVYIVFCFRCIPYFSHVLYLLGDQDVLMARDYTHAGLQVHFVMYFGACANR